MSRVLTFSRFFPSYHARRGEPTYFVEKIWRSLLPENSPLRPYWMDDKWLINDDNTKSIPWDYEPKHHTIRAGHRWKVGDKFSPCVWVLPGGRFTKGNKQIIIAPDIEVKKVWDFDIIDLGGVDCIRIDGEPFGQFHPLAKGCQDIAKNDGLTAIELIQWFSKPSPIVQYQIICWNGSIEY